MINTITKKTVRREKCVLSVTCDKCKKEISPDNVVEMQEVFHIRFTGGYGSVFGDESQVECDLCQHCLKELIGPYYRSV
jgi:hypothetical protein